MSDDRRLNLPSDVTLSAFLRNELSLEDYESLLSLLATDEALAQRLKALDSEPTPLRKAFDLLISEAPSERMTQRFQQTVNTGDKTEGISRRRFIAAAAACFAAGMVLDQFIARGRVSQLGQDGSWREAVANYMELYSRTTLQDLWSDPTMLDGQVAIAGSHLGIKLTRNGLTVPGLSLKSAEILRFAQKPLAQFVYLDSEQEPLALCIFAESTGKEAPRTEKRHGMILVFWSNATHSYLVIGHSSANRLRLIADCFCRYLPA